MSSQIEKRDAEVFETTSVSEGSICDVASVTDEQLNYVLAILGYSTVDPSVELHDRNFLILLAGVQKLTLDEAREIVHTTIIASANDRNFPPKLRELFLRAPSMGEKDVIYDGVTGDWAIRAIAGIMRYSSPYPEVRACTNFWDNPKDTCESIRVYVLATVWIGVYSFVNQFFEIRYPAITIPQALLQMLAVPCGRFLAAVVPDWGFTLAGTRYTLNPGPWTYKEQSLFLVALGQASNPYVDSQILVQKLEIFYDNHWANFGYQLLITISTQFLGFGLAGIFRNLMVYPYQNVYFNNLSSMALNNALMSSDKKENINGWSITRYHLFGVALIGIFFYEWLPLYLATFLSNFNWMNWIAPNNFNLGAISGMVTGLGFSPLATLDWSIFQSNGMILPFFANVNTVAGLLIGGIASIGVYYSNMYYTAYLPINSNYLFTNTGDTYSVSEILTDNRIDEAKYQAYSPPYYAAANLMAYGAFFALYTCIYVTTLLYDFDSLMESFKQFYLGIRGRGKSVAHYSDPHSRMMQRYPETPQWWFMVVLLIALVVGIVTVKVYPTEAPVWGIFLGIGLTILFVVPACILVSRTGSSLGINVLMELIVGYAIPGRGVALMVLKTFGVNTHNQAVSYISDLKVGHYTKVPPRSSFRLQIWAAIVSMFVTLGTMQFQMTIPKVCTKALENTSKFTCPNEVTYYSASVLWGVIGPKRIFDGQYPVLKWCFLMGAVIPLPLWAARKFIPRLRPWLKHIEPNIMLNGMQNYAPQNLNFYLPNIYIGLVFMVWIKRKYTRWFEKYNYVLAAGLNTGTALAAFIIFWAVQYHNITLDWWGNNVSNNNQDGIGGSLLNVPDIGYFGPAPGSYFY